MRLAVLLNLVAYSVVASQPLAYLVFLRRAQEALSAPAYVELRQGINPVMLKRLPAIYLGALLTALLVLALAIREGAAIVVASTAVALVCLLVDVVLMTRASVPINGAMDRWSATDYPADWQTYRARWFAVFAYRQVVLLAGFLGLLAGAAFGP